MEYEDLIRIWPAAGQGEALEERNAGNETKRVHDLIHFLPVFILAALVRAIPFQYVFTSEGVVLTDGDAYSHMWRIWNAASKSIPLSARDLFVNFPHGGEVVWSPAFDWILATLIRWLGLDQPSAELLCAWVPVLLGAVVVVFAAVIAARTFSRTAGWVTGIMLAVLPASFIYTQLGALDHHAAITLVGTAMLGGAMRVVSGEGAGPRFWPPLGGALCAFVLLIWAGALLHVGVLQIAMLTWALGTASRELAQARTLRLAMAHAVAAVMILPFSLRVWEFFGDFNPLVLTRFQPIWFAAGAICLASAAILWRVPMLGDSRIRRLASAAVLGVVGLALAFVMIPGLAAILDQSAGWFTKDVEFLANITELAPLFSIGGYPIWWAPLYYLSPLLFVIPLSLIAVVWRTPRPERLLLVFWTAAFCVLTLTQFRFTNTFSVAHSIVGGGAIALLFDWIGQRAPTLRTRWIARAFVGIMLAVMLLGPSWLYYAPHLRDRGFAVINVLRKARIEVARWLATSRPVTLDENGNPTSGLMTVWSAGHDFRYFSGWPVHQDGFGPYVSPENTKLSSRYFEALDEDNAIAILERLGTRYVAADIQGAGQPPYESRSMASRLVRLQGSGGIVMTGDSGQRQWVPALSRHRLVFLAPNRNGGAWLYEVVRGAVVVGSATPGSAVVVELRFGSPSGDPRIWSTRQRADETGEFRLGLPYATIGAPDSRFTPLGPYRLRTELGVTEFDITEDLVQNGGTINAPAID